MAYGLVLSFAVGFLFNEEMFLKRLATRLSYPHEGWFVLSSNAAAIIMGITVLTSFFKGYAWGSFLHIHGKSGWHICALMFIMGNIFALKDDKHLYYSLWLSFGGLLLSWDIQAFRLFLTACSVFGLLKLGLAVSSSAWQVAAGIVFFISLGSEGFYWIALLLSLAIFSKRQSPKTGGIIEYLKKIVRWRVMT